MNQPALDALTLTIAQISDVHLQRGNQDRLDRFDKAMSLAMSHAPDCIVLSGDLTEDGFDHPADLAWAKPLIDAVKIPLFLIPGNHDVGDKPNSGPNAITPQRLANWINTFGSDHFVQDIAAWRLIGINSLLIASGFPEESRQLDWLDRMLSQAQMLGQNTAIFMHEPPFLGQPGHSFGNRSDYWPIAPEKQPLYLRHLAHPTVKLVASGHVHWYQASERAGVLHTWCPSPAFIVEDPNFPRGGEVAGLLIFKLKAHSVTHQLIRYDQPGTQVIQFHAP